MWIDFINTNVANAVYHPFSAIIFNLSLSTGNVPDLLKIAKMIQIFIKDDADIFPNYQPVSVLPWFPKHLKG